MKRKIALVLCVMMFSILCSGYEVTGAEVETQQSDSVGKAYDESMVTEGHLPDYTEMYGYEQTETNGLYARTYSLRPVQQQFQYIAVFVEFPDMGAYDLDTEECAGNAEKYFNAAEGSATVNNGYGVSVPVTSLKNYVEKYSYGKCSVTASVFPKDGSGKLVSYMSQKPRSYYLKYDPQTNTNGYRGINEQNQRELELINEVIQGVKDQILGQYDSGQLDVNGDRIVDAISFFVESEARGNCPIGWSDLLWSHKLSGANIALSDELTVATYNLLNCYDYTSSGGMFSSVKPTYGTIIHEYVHTLGFPDLYRYHGSGEPVGLYDLMATTDTTMPQGLLAYMISEHNSLGWHTELDEIVSSTSGVTLKKAEYQDPSEPCAVKVRSPINNDEFFVVEYIAARTNTAVTADQSGVIVYRVNSDYTDIGNQLGGYQGDEDYIYIFREGDSSANEGNNDNSALQKATLNLSRPTKGKTAGFENASFDPDTLYFTDGTNSGICLKVTSETENSVTFDVTIPETGGTGEEEEENEQVPEEESPVPEEESVPSVYYSTHVQSYGWQPYRKDGEMSGTSGQSKRLEAIKIYVSGSKYSGGIEYCTHVQTYGWQSYKSDNAMSGTSGQSKRLEAIRIRLTGELAQHYDIYYRVHAQTFGWLGWAKNGESAGSQGYAKRLEGIEIRIVKKGSAAPGETGNAFRSTKISYRTHVQTYGWQSYVCDGSVSGTSGQSKRLEAIQIKKANDECSGSIEYRTHIQTYGWEKDWKRDGQTSGTSGEAKRLEAIQIRLTGELSEKYDIYYRVHAQTYGWLGWAKNGENAGTEGLAKRLEAIEIVLVEKGGQPPSGNTTAFVK